ncbi:uncharacterized protein EDB93DRAFT_1104954 [Suillus bovinus]|uniref:uncharacterized protein n=1 Tax=Suillus bovinus TaxID=48563 RepID=UPI001B88581A|nr:uncharacterized protein EDB93DRAFT_1104954 [Suillus bovinus]KAG2144390.1 hypothetical protein EDB93DRAFT_1104954 [Suillus bovinus]
MRPLELIEELCGMFPLFDNQDLMSQGNIPLPRASRFTGMAPRAAGPDRVQRSFAPAGDVASRYRMVYTYLPLCGAEKSRQEFTDGVVFRDETMGVQKSTTRQYKLPPVRPPRELLVSDPEPTPLATTTPPSASSTVARATRATVGPLVNERDSKTVVKDAKNYVVVETLNKSLARPSLLYLQSKETVGSENIGVGSGVGLLGMCRMIKECVGRKSESSSDISGPKSYVIGHVVLRTMRKHVITLYTMLSKSKGVNAHLVGIDATGQDIGRTGAMRGNVGSGSDMRWTVGKCVGSGLDCQTRVGVVGNSLRKLWVEENLSALYKTVITPMYTILNHFKQSAQDLIEILYSLQLSIWTEWTAQINHTKSTVTFLICDDSLNYIFGNSVKIH